MKPGIIMLLARKQKVMVDHETEKSRNGMKKPELVPV